MFNILSHYNNNNAIDISTIDNSNKQIIDYEFSHLQNTGVPILIDSTKGKNVDEKLIIIQYAVLCDYFNENNNSENYYKVNNIYSEVGQPNFNNGIIIEKDLPRFITSNNKVIQEINDHFKIKMRSRYPTQVAYIIKDGDELKVIFNHQELEQVIKRAGSRPIIFVASFGRYQQGKTLINSGITGNLGYIVGNGNKETTKGVYIDGPYSVDYLYQRFNIDIRKDIYYVGNELLSPLVFFFDIEGYDGIMHGNDIQKNNDAYIEMCAPFLCLSSVFILLTEPNTNSQEIQNFFERVKVSKLTTYSNSNESNGVLQLNIIFNKYNRVVYDYGNYNQTNIKEIVHKFQKRIQKEWIGVKDLNKYGIKYKFSPIVEGFQPFYDNGCFFDFFQYFVKNIVRSIERAAEGKFVRSASQSLILFDYIIEHYNDESFEEKIKLLIRSEHENSFETFSIRACQEIESIISPMIDNEFKKYHNSFNFSVNIDEIKNKYIGICETKIQNELMVVKDHQKVSYHVEKLKASIQSKINDKYEELINYKKEIFDEFNKKIEQKADQLVSDILNQFYNETSGDCIFDFNQKMMTKFINEKAQTLKKDLYCYKNEENLFLLQDQKIETLVSEKENTLSTMISIYINNEITNSNQLKEEMDMNLTIIKLYKDEIIREYNCRENHEMANLKGKLSKSFYIENFKRIFEIHQKCQNSILDHILSIKSNLIDNICKELERNNATNAEIIQRMKQKNELNIDDKIILNIINENKNELISKINFEFDKAKFDLSYTEYFNKRTKISWNKVKVEKN